MGGKVGLAAKVKNNGGYFQLDYTRKGQERQPHKQKTPKKPHQMSVHFHLTVCIFAKCCLYSSELFFHVVNVWTQKNGLRWLWGKKLNSSAYFESMWHFSLFILQIQNTMMKTISSFQLLEVNFSYNNSMYFRHECRLTY